MNEQIQDLIMAGVKWELSDISTGFKDEMSVVSSAMKKRVATSVVPPIAPAAPVDSDTVAAMAMRPTTTDALGRMILEFNHPLRGGVTNVVVPHVAQNPSGLMVITDIPSSDDDASGNILSGAAGELFDKMMAAIGLSRDTIHITPILFWRTPGGRTPTREEIDLGRPFVSRFIELTEPRIIITLGAISASEIAGTDLMRNHGANKTINNGINVFSIYHPNYLMLKPSMKQDVWTVLQTVQKLLKSL